MGRDIGSIGAFSRRITDINSMNKIKWHDLTAKAPMGKATDWHDCYVSTCSGHYHPSRQLFHAFSLEDELWAMTGQQEIARENTLISFQQLEETFLS